MYKTLNDGDDGRIKNTANEYFGCIFINNILLRVNCQMTSQYGGYLWSKTKRSDDHYVFAIFGDIHDIWQNQ